MNSKWKVRSDDHDGAFYTQLKVVSRAVQDDFYNSPIHHRCWDETLSVQIAPSE